MKYYFLLGIALMLCGCYVTRKQNYHYGQFTDSRDGRIYKTVKIGRKIWMAENLAYEFDPGPKNARSECYSKNEEYSRFYGRLYNFDALLQGVAPKGWHIASDAEWQEMEAITGPNAISVLNILCAGEANGNSQFSNFGTEGAFYTSTQDGYPIIIRYVLKGDNKIHTSRRGIGYELSVRCVKDTDVVR